MLDLKQIFAVGLGGFVGSVLRYLVSVWMGTGYFSYKTLFVNIVGSFAIGIIAGLGVKGTLYSMLAVGLCGGFTTFSTFSLEILNMYGQGNFWPAVLYAVLSLVFSVGAAAAGIWMCSNLKTVIL